MRRENNFGGYIVWEKVRNSSIALIHILLDL